MTSLAIGLFMNTGRSGMRRSAFNRWMASSSVCARPTAKAGTTTMPPRAAVRLMTSANAVREFSTGCERLP